MDRPSHVLHLTARSGTRGEPRACYVCVNAGGDVVNVIEAGKAGPAAYRNIYGPLTEINLQVTVPEFRRWVRQFPQRPQVQLPKAKPARRAEDRKFRVVRGGGDS